MKERKLQEIGKSLLVTVPKEWANTLRLKKGSTVRMSVADNGALLIAPEFTGKVENRKVSIPFDVSGERRFFREYFSGAQEITLNIKERPDSDARSFLRTFMNVQLVEESKDKLVVKCFPIDELTIDECLSRMFFLSLNLFDDAIASAPKDVRNATEESLTRFYYLLVMQIRCFLSEGRFARAQISLIRAMDMRMVAERIERIADILKRLDVKRSEIGELQDTKKFYKQAFGCFRECNFNDAVPLWAAERELRKYIKSPHASTIVRLAKEISSFVR